MTDFDYGEGWTGPRIGKGQHNDFKFTFANLFKGSVKPELEIILAGRNNRRHKVEVFAGASTLSLRSLGETEFQYYNTLQLTKDLEWTDFSPGGELAVRITVKGFDDNVPDYVSVSSVNVRAPAEWSIDADTLHHMYLRNNPVGKSYLEINNSLASFTLYDVTNVYDLRKVGYNHSGGITAAILDQTQEGRTLALVGSKYLSVNDIGPVEFHSITPGNYNYFIVTHSDLMKASGQRPDPVKAYADYRASATGGGLKPFIADIDRLYDQFTYGEKSPLAIRRFCDYMIGENADDNYLFLIGKGLDISYNYYRQDLSTYPHKSYVPPAGFPASDVFFTAGLAGTGYEPAMPTGRLTALSPQDVEAYLNKIKEMEALSHDALWRKELIHLSGGLTLTELNLFNRYVKDFQEIAESDFLGGEVHIVSKKSNSSTELINISGEINSGKTMVTFFGHSAGITTDLDIGFVSDDGFGYRNKGKYPVILVNGCNAGQIFSPTETLGENWILTPDRGAIGFLASGTLGYASYLKRYTDQFYEVAYADSLFINQSLGAVQKETIRRYLNLYAQTELNVCQAQQMNLQGDPYYRMFAAEKPDYAVTDTDLLVKSFDGEKITFLTDSFQIGVIAKNFGRTTTHPLQVVVERTAGNESFLYDPRYFDPVKYIDTLWFTVDNREFEGAGKNTFTIYLDYSDSVQELNESNNSAAIDYFIPLRSTRNLIPYNYGIVNQRDLILTAQSSDLLGQNRDFIIELDTTADFNSLFKKQWTVNAKALFSAEAQLLSADSLVYFWRSKFASPLPDEDNSWSVSSFTFINDGPEGWAQSHFHQIRQNEIVGLTIGTGDREFHFEETENEIELTTYGPSHPEADHTNVTLSVNGLSYIFGSRLCTDNSINMVAFDQASTAPYLGLDFGGWDVLDRRRCGRRPQLVNNFIHSEIADPQKYYINKYLDQIPDGDYVLLFSIGEATFGSWPEDVKNKLSEIGVSNDLFDRLQDGYPVVILGTKGGSPGSALELLPDTGGATPPLEQSLTLKHTLFGKYSAATISTPLIGPSMAWDKLYTSVAQNPNDEASFTIMGVKSNGEQTPLHEDLQDPELDLSGIDPVTYPYIRLVFNVSDPLDLTPAQVEQWMALYEPAPDGVIGWESPGVHFTRQEGEELEINLSFQNISAKDFTDSILVAYSNYNQNKRVNEELSVRIPPVAAGEKEAFTLAISTRNKAGKNNLKVEANPEILPEQNYYNNLIELTGYLEVEQDLTHPVIDVLVDGRYIIDGDIVSPTPLVIIRMKDENQHLFKQDTTGVEILLKRECEACNFKRINFSQPNVHWTPAGENKDFQVEFQPETLEDGLYVLQVQATDASGNASGSNPYRIRFEVVNESTITNFYPYPNPFSTSTRFVFTLTGAQIPDKIKIQIMTISGKVVREITQDELGPLHIGHNMTDFAWDGKDEYGDQLANGVYLYRVIMQQDGQVPKHRDTAGDRAFKHGIGKLYLLR